MRILVAGLLLVLSSISAPMAPPETSLIAADSVGPLDLRGYGRVTADGWLWQAEDGRQAGLVRFYCQSPEAAATVASKYLADLLAYGAATVGEPLPGLAATVVEVRHGPSFLLGLAGSDVIVASAANRQALAAAALAWDGAEWEAPEPHTYPRWLDNFDNEGLAIWWMPNTKSAEEMAWFQDHPSAANLHQQRLSSTPAPGVLDMSGVDNAIAQLKPTGKAYRHMLWCGGGKESWVNWMQLPGHNLETDPDGFLGRRFFEAGGYNAHQVTSPEIDALIRDALLEVMRERVDDPDLLGWMEPHGEFHLTEPIGLPPGYESRFPAFLQLEKGYNLETISEAYTGNRQAYSAWADVPYPSTAYFAGLRGHVIELDDTPWRWEPGSLPDGEGDGWHTPDFDDSDWGENLRGNRILLSQWDNSRVSPLWYRFRYDIPADYLQETGDAPLYLHIMPFTEKEGRSVSVWVNGQEAGRDLYDRRAWKNTHVQVDIRPFLQPGSNHFVIYSHGGRIAYRVFLSDVRSEDFPFEEPHLSQQYLDWRDYYIWEKLQTLERYLITMRSIDPNRPIKIMTPHLFQTEAMELMERYGAYPQLTGEGSWYRPMHYKGYSSLRRLPGSSEPGGPQKTAKSTQTMFAMIFWESQDCHDYVFDFTRDFWPYKEVVEWWGNRKPLLDTLGKTDLGEFQVGVLRDVRQADRYGNGAIWNWDLSRGPLPAMGLTPVLVDGPEFMQGNADDVPVLIDCATIIMEPAMVDAVKRYVEQGGVFIAQHHTGQHRVDQPDAWPLAKTFGLDIQPKLLNEENYHKWPLGKIRFTEEQDLFPSLQGKGAEGSGVAIDWEDNEYTGAIGIRGDESAAKPVALWEDGSMAVTDVHYGKGRFILLGTPFYLRFRDVNGKWLNDLERQALLEELLTSVGVERRTQVSDERVWFERRDSKNGLYDVYFACAMGIRDKEWTFEDTLTTQLSARRGAGGTAVEPTAEGTPDVATTFTDNHLGFGEQTFEPYQVRQFAVVRENVGLAGPLHWLEVQRRHWRALKPVASSLGRDIAANVQALATKLGEDGVDISNDWQVRRDAEETTTRWIATDVDALKWETGAMGSWLEHGWHETELAQYRKRVELPADWQGARVLIGFLGYFSQGIEGKGRLWVDGEPLADELPHLFMYDVTEAAADGVLNLALQVSADGLERGPIGTMYLRKLPQPVATIDLADGWTEMAGWQHDRGPIALPLDGKEKIFGLKRTIELPEKWAGHPVRLVIDYTRDSRHAKVEGILINQTGYFRDEAETPIGARLDGEFESGPNQITLLGFGHMRDDYIGFPAEIANIRLEILP